ncbi:magnesium transporter CorA, partial [Pseudomonas graminis]
EEPGHELDPTAAIECLRQPTVPDEFVWLHLNLTHASCKRWLKTNLDLPDEFLEAPHEGSRSTRIEPVDSALLAVVNDV